MLVSLAGTSVTWRRYGAAMVVLACALLAAGPVPGAAAADTVSAAPAPATGHLRVAGSAASIRLTARATTLRGRYIVELRDGVDVRDVADGYRGTVSVRRRYASALTGFSAAMSAQTAAVLAADPRVTTVEADVALTLSAVQKSPVWGLDRTDQRRRPLDATYVYDKAGAGVSIYIVDTGVYRRHNEFGTRVRSGFDATGGGSTADCVGHGTHVAGTAAGTTFGVAKKARIIPIRVLNCRGYGTKSQLIAGLDWLVKDHQHDEPAVANLSLGGTASRVVDRAVNRVLDDGVTVVAAAGNEGNYRGTADACDYSPGRVSRVITVAAINRYDERAPWSNYGPCVDLFAPGARIQSAAIAHRSATATHSGTSMAAPFAAGVAARFLSDRPSAGPRRVADALEHRATPDIVTYQGWNTTRHLLHMPSRVPTRIGISLRDTAILTGDEAVVRATLRNTATGATIADKTLKIYHRPAGTTTWSHLANRTTDAEGRVRVKHLPVVATEYRARHVKTATTKSHISDVVKISVQG